MTSYWDWGSTEVRDQTLEDLSRVYALATDKPDEVSRHDCALQSLQEVTCVVQTGFGVHVFQGLDLREFLCEGVSSKKLFKPKLHTFVQTLESWSWRNRGLKHQNRVSGYILSAFRTHKLKTLKEH